MHEAPLVRHTVDLFPHWCKGCFGEVCQVELARKIVDQGRDYVLSLQENQPGLHRDGAELFEWLRRPHPID